MTHQELNALRTRNIQTAEDAKEALLRLYRERGGDYSPSDKTARTAKMITAFFYLMTSNDTETRVEAHDLYVKYQRSMARADAFDLAATDMK